MFLNSGTMAHASTGPKNGRVLIAQRLRDAFRIRRQDIVEAATQASLAKSTVYSWLAGTSDQSAEGIRALAPILRVSADYLLGLSDSLTGEASIDMEKEGEQITMLPRVAGRVGAGPARVDVPSKPLRYAFRTAWLQRRGLSPERLVTVIVAKHGGDSMEPLIKPDSLLIIDRGSAREGIIEDEMKDGSIYLVRHPDEEGMKVKRVYRSGDALVLWSDNPNASPRAEVVPLKGKRLQEILLGRVVWVGRDEE